MRTQVLALLGIIFVLSSNCVAGRIDKVHAGMTRTDVAIALGSPMDVKVIDQSTVWIYPESESQVCLIKFVDQKVTQEEMKCEKKEPSSEFTVRVAPYLRAMSSDTAYRDRVKRYCGVKPQASPGCRITEQCVNGGWEEVCGGGQASNTGGGS